MKKTLVALSVFAVLILWHAPVHAQEVEMEVVDEVIAEVGENVITLSQVRREIKETVDALATKDPNRDRAEIEAEVAQKRGNLIANIINEELLMQRARERGYDTYVEAEINRRFLQQMQQLNLNSLDQLYRQMRANGIEPDQVREVWTKQLTADFVLQRDVDQAVFEGWKKKELEAYYESNKDRFKKPETVTVSEIFLNFAGLNEDDVRQQALEIIARARAGEDFGDLAVEFSDRSGVEESRGKVGELTVAEIDPQFAEPLKGLKVGEVTDPIFIESGIEILRVDARSAASDESRFNEKEVRSAMTYEVLEEKRKEFMMDLRKDTYIKIKEDYRPEVSPVLFADERKASSSSEPGR